MKTRFQIVDHKDGIVLDTVLESRNRFSALHELLRLSGIHYNPAQFKERAGWVEFRGAYATYKTTTRFG